MSDFTILRYLTLVDTKGVSLFYYYNFRNGNIDKLYESAMNAHTEASSMKFASKNQGGLLA